MALSGRSQHSQVASEGYITRTHTEQDPNFHLISYISDASDTFLNHRGAGGEMGEKQASERLQLNTPRRTGQGSSEWQRESRPARSVLAV